jgi:hypothetical protein
MIKCYVYTDPPEKPFEQINLHKQIVERIPVCDRISINLSDDPDVIKSLSALTKKLNFVPNEIEFDAIKFKTLGQLELPYWRYIARLLIDCFLAGDVSEQDAQNYLDKNVSAKDIAAEFSRLFKSRFCA